VTTSLQLRRSLAHSPERVWRAFTDPTALASWFWPARFGTKAEIDLRVGGRYRIDGPGAGMAVSGDYVHVEPPARLAFTWRWHGDPDETLVSVDFVPTDTGTDLVITHELFSGDSDRDNHTQGWEDCLDRLPGWLSAHS
jgi:uncharacterized protein YndB with AHSA1/START domain